MRRLVAGSILLLAASGVACGLDVVGSAGVAGGGPSIDGGADGRTLPGNGDEGGSVLVDATPGGVDDATADAAADADAAAPLVPSHVPGGVTFDPGAPAVSGITQIDTTNHTITVGGGAPGLPAGVTFSDQGGIAVLRTGTFTIDVGCAIVGASPLVVLANGAVTVSAKLDASAKLDVPGAGGAAPVSGTGHGTSGMDVGSDSSGGGGAGFGTAGARGANASTTSLGGAAGMPYGSLRTDLNGGSGGGNGSPYGGCGNKGRGGAGGGAVQISSAVSITITATGVIAVNGGGGHGGCDNGSSTMSGGGGGSGGEIFLEAQTIAMGGALVANGGGGGGAGYNGLGDGSDGQNGGLTTAAASGGTGASNGYGGGAGGSSVAAPKVPTDFTGPANAGGGGGAVGHVWLRTRGAAATVNGPVVSPAPMIDTTF